LSAVLFCVALAFVLLKTEETCGTGFSIAGLIISNFGYDDDLAFVNNCPCKLQEFLITFAKNAEKIGLQINLSKSVCM